MAIPIRTEPLTEAGFRPFGEILDLPLFRPSETAFVETYAVGRFPFHLTKLFQRTETCEITPLTSTSYVVICAMDFGNAPGAISAFLATTYHSLRIKSGIWHHPPIPLYAAAEFSHTAHAALSKGSKHIDDTYILLDID